MSRSIYHFLFVLAFEIIYNLKYVCECDTEEKQKGLLVIMDRNSPFFIMVSNIDGI